MSCTVIERMLPCLGGVSTFKLLPHTSTFLNSRNVLVDPGHRSLFSAGIWNPAREELSTIRSNLLRSSARLRRIISAPEFVSLFGEAKPDPVYEQNIFGRSDALKVAPKGIDKNHKDIDLLKCKTMIVGLPYVSSFHLIQRLSHTLDQFDGR